MPDNLKGIYLSFPIVAVVTIDVEELSLLVFMSQQRAEKTAGEARCAGWRHNYSLYIN